jgi:hypothetical protein
LNGKNVIVDVWLNHGWLVRSAAVFEVLTATRSPMTSQHNIGGNQEPKGVIAHKGNINKYRNY